MAAVTFRIHYATQWGETLQLEHRLATPDAGTAAAEVLPLHHDGAGFWSAALDAVEVGTIVEYRYAFIDPLGEARREPVHRQLEIAADGQVVWDHFLAPELPDGAFLRQAFAGVIFNPNRSDAPPVEPTGGRRLRLTLRAPRVMAGHRLCVSGSHPLLGEWDPSRARVMSGARYPVWVLDLPAEAFGGPMEFKFGLWNEKEQRLVQFEAGANRRFDGTLPGTECLVVNYEQFRHAYRWRGAGVAIPVFSLRSEQGYGVGEFADLAPFAEWAAQCHLHLVQLLPVNDTSSDFTWKDSYPYKAVSTAALHPIYLNLDRVFRDCRVPLPKTYAARRAALNRLPQLDYEAVLREKLALLRGLFERVRARALASPAFRRYRREQGPWLQPYAAFCRLRDLHGTADFSQWGPDANYAPGNVATWFSKSAPEYNAVMFHCWVQFHLDRQLARALAAGHALGVAFKGDLPIGIDRSSVEAWTEPDLFRMDRQTGAPPDAFAVLGQNWGFPTYRWSRMAADGFAWWRRRFHRMSMAFDALRIDHILGFFRIWEIPLPHKEGILGHYDPTQPLTREELRAAGFEADPRGFGPGTVAPASLPEFFGKTAVKIASALLVRGADDYWRVRPEFASAEARQAWYAKARLRKEAARLEDGFTRLGYEALFLEDPDQPDRFHPRINFADTALFRSFDEPAQEVLRELHDDFYYRRHTQFWAAEAMKKLPVLMDASSMLICGEDLGNVPDSVPLVLQRLGLLSLEVQRWPKELGRAFGTPSAYPYLSVCTTSTHDMSTIRGWWEEEPETRQRFFAGVMKGAGVAPAECSPDQCRFIVAQNLAAASMWCILPLQDWLGMDPELRHPVAADERINVPAIPRYYWRYRMHLGLEALRGAHAFNQAVAELVEASGRHRSD